MANQETHREGMLLMALGTVYRALIQGILTSPCFTRSKGLNGSIPISLVFNRVKQVPFPGVTIKTTEKHLGDCQINSHVLEWIHLPLTVDHPKGSLSRNQDAATGKQHAPRVGDYVSKCKS